MFGVVDGTFTFSIKAKLFNAVAIGNLFLLNESSVALLYLARDHLKGRGGVGVLQKGTASAMRAHYASAKKIRTISAEVMGMFVDCANYCARLFDWMATVFTNH
jgi:hypothetical protein